MEKNLIFSIDVGGTDIKLAILTIEGLVLKKWKIPTNKQDRGKYIIDEIFLDFFKKLKTLNLKREQFLGVGMGAPGPVLPSGKIKKATNFGWENVPLKKKLEEKFNMPAFVANDANCAALGEMWIGAGVGLKDLVCITLGTGVGGGIIANGELVNGVWGSGGEIGHMTVQMENGHVCNCGKKGCLETIASATGIVGLAQLSLQEKKESVLQEIMIKQGKISSKDIFDGVAKEDALAISVVDQVAKYLGYAIGTLAATLNPEAIIIGGGVSNAGNTLLNPVKMYYQQFAFPDSAHDTKILISNLGNDAGVAGAAYLVKSNEGILR